MACIFSVELVYRDLLVKEACDEFSDEEKEALPLVVEAYSKIMQIVESSVVDPPSIFQARLIADGCVRIYII